MGRVLEMLFNKGLVSAAAFPCVGAARRVQGGVPQPMEGLLRLLILVWILLKWKKWLKNGGDGVAGSHISLGSLVGTQTSSLLFSSGKHCRLFFLPPAFCWLWGGITATDMLWEALFSRYSQPGPGNRGNIPSEVFLG